MYVTLPRGSYTDDKGCKRTMDPLSHSYFYTDDIQGSNRESIHHADIFNKY
jgi:hypothetical protein